MKHVFQVWVTLFERDVAAKAAAGSAHHWVRFVGADSVRGSDMRAGFVERSVPLGFLPSLSLGQVLGIVEVVFAHFLTDRAERE